VISRIIGAALMRRKIRFLFLLISIPAIAANFGANEVTFGGELLRDGVFLPGMEGKLFTGDSNEGAQRYFFEFSSSVNDVEVTLQKGRLIEVLPNDTLESMLEEMGRGNIVRFRLWSRATQYKGKNYLFPTYYLPMVKKIVEAAVREKIPIKDANIVRQKTQKKESGEVVKKAQVITSVNEVNDILSLPEEVLKKIQGKEKEAGSEPNEASESVEKDKLRTVTTKEQRIEIETGPRPLYRPNPILVDRLGDIIKADDKGFGQVGKYKFVPNAFGYGISRDNFILLPCQALEQAEKSLLESPDQLRYEAAGITANFKGQKYLLLYRTIRAHSHGNFMR